ncbi:MAG: hypothetical protein ACI85I_002431 [Arenicella sp.]|jgi:hypothetical protein
MNWIEKLKTRWEVKSGWQVLAILLVFTLTGFSSLYVKKPIYALLDIDATTLNGWQKFFSVIFITLPVYQVLLLFYGTILGQFRFFWEFEKRTLSRIGKLFTFWKK